MDDSSWGTSHTEAIESLTRHGRDDDIVTGSSQYLCHTSTIPLATTVDSHWLLQQGSAKTSTSFHGYQETEQHTVHCPKKRCMFVTSSHNRKSQVMLSNCPCKDIPTIDGESLHPICFMVFLKSINSNLTHRPDEYVQEIDPSLVAFCHDANGAFDNSYSGSMRDTIDITGWGHVDTYNKLLRVMGCLYWFRKHSKDYKIEDFIREEAKTKPLHYVKKYITQTLHTINGLLIKKFISFGPELVGYRDLADQTARLFRDLLKDYLKPSVENAGTFISQDSVFLEIKDFLNHCKESFHGPSLARRTEWLTTRFRCRSLGSFFGTEIGRLKMMIDSNLSLNEEDYTESLAWQFRCGIMSQTRVLGYLPPHVAEIKRINFRDTVNRPIEKIGPDECKLVYTAIQSYFKFNKIPVGLFKSGTTESQQIITSAIENISVDIKQNASTDHTVSQGGKIEDARLLVNLAITNGWKVPVRNLDTHEIEKWIDFESHNPDIESWARPLFWLSYQLMLNFFIHRGKWPSEDFSSLKIAGKEFQEDPLIAKILHISEPGKERNLTKCKAIYAWFLTPIGKVCQSVLANIPEHTAGLELSAHGWMHTRRISSESEESGFVYHSGTGETRTNVVHSFKDWTESTDWIRKYIGMAAFSGMLDYLNFFRKYGRLAKMLVMCPQPVEEVIHRTVSQFSSDEKFEEYHFAWKGAIREGFMMGNPVTKTILHLMHGVEFINSKRYLSDLGFDLDRGKPLSTKLGRGAKLPRDTTNRVAIAGSKIYSKPFIRR